MGERIEICCIFEGNSNIRVKRFRNNFSGGRYPVRGLKDADKNRCAIADFSFMMVAVDLGPQQIEFKSCLKKTHCTSFEEVHRVSPKGSSKNLVPELLPAMSAPIAEVFQC
ncbi:hypothetical protein TNCV_3282281 [Trichonephila clavipes]|nr:hypothetical protein TNCV_3282281 [Trichonephila clavipes]